MNAHAVDLSRALNEFRGMVARRTVSTHDGVEFTLHDWGPATASGEPPLICLHSLSGSESELFRPQLSLGAKGFRTIACRIPVVWDLASFVQAFDELLNVLDVGDAVHLHGVHLGGLLLQVFAAHKPRRVLSLVLTNSFCDTSEYAFALGATAIKLAPSVYLQHCILDDFPDGPTDPAIAAAIDFEVDQVEGLSPDELAARLCLYSEPVDARALSRIDSSRVTLIQAADQTMLSERVLRSLSQTYANARVATIKRGGDFVCLTNPDEVAMHVQVHLRRHGVAPPEAALPLAIAPPPPRAAPAFSEHGEYGEQEFDAPPSYVAV